MATAENVKAKITILHDMRPATGDSSNRYALGCVQAIPRDGGAYLCATNGMIAAVVRAEGECGEVCLIPPAVLPSKKAHWGKAGAVNIEINGECRASFGQFAPRPESAETAPRFPKLEQVFPGNVSDETHWAVSIDAELLRDLAEALGRNEADTFDRDARSGKAVTLFVRKDRKAENDQSPIGVAGPRGVGVIMSIGGPNGRTLSDTPEEYAEAVKQFQIAAERARK